MALNKGGCFLQSFASRPAAAGDHSARRSLSPEAWSVLPAGMSAKRKLPSSAASVEIGWPLWSPHQVRPEGAPLGLGTEWGQWVGSQLSLPAFLELETEASRQRGHSVRSPGAKGLFLEALPLEQFCWVLCWRHLSLFWKFLFCFLERIRGSPSPLAVGSVGWLSEGGFRRTQHGSGTPGTGLARGPTACTGFSLVRVAVGAVLVGPRGSWHADVPSSLGLLFSALFTCSPSRGPPPALGFQKPLRP